MPPQKDGREKKNLQVGVVQRKKKFKVNREEKKHLIQFLFMFLREFFARFYMRALKIAKKKGVKRLFETTVAVGKVKRNRF